MIQQRLLLIALAIQVSFRDKKKKMISKSIHYFWQLRKTIFALVISKDFLYRVSEEALNTGRRYNVPHRWNPMSAKTEHKTANFFCSSSAQIKLTAAGFLQKRFLEKKIKEIFILTFVSEIRFIS